MINKDRIVPIQKSDLLSMYGTIINGICLVAQQTPPSVLAASNVDGDFVVTGSGSAGSFLANQPVKTLEFASGVTGAEVFFVAGYDYAGMTINGTPVVPTGAVEADGVTLYQATLSSGAVTVVAMTPSQSE